MNVLMFALITTVGVGDLPGNSRRAVRWPTSLPPVSVAPQPAHAATPYGSPPVAPVAKPPNRSPYGIIRYDKSATVKPAAPSNPPRLLPAIPVSRPTTKPTPPPPVLMLPSEGLIPPPTPLVPLSSFEKALNRDRISPIRVARCPADWLTFPLPAGS